jgi:hypothetical protein
MLFEMNKPSPVPVTDSVPNLANNLGKRSEGIPVPVSLINKTTPLVSLCCIKVIEITPSVVNFIALL